jgi:hypothetical protein
MGIELKLVRATGDLACEIGVPIHGCKVRGQLDGNEVTYVFGPKQLWGLDSPLQYVNIFTAAFAPSAAVDQRITSSAGGVCALAMTGSISVLKHFLTT